MARRNGEDRITGRRTRGTSEKMSGMRAPDRPVLWSPKGEEGDDDEDEAVKAVDIIEGVNSSKARPPPPRPPNIDDDAEAGKVEDEDNKFIPLDWDMDVEVVVDAIPFVARGLFVKASTEPWNNRWTSYDRRDTSRGAETAPDADVEEEEEEMEEEEDVDDVGLEETGDVAAYGTHTAESVKGP